MRFSPRAFAVLAGFACAWFFPSGYLGAQVSSEVLDQYFHYEWRAGVGWRPGALALSQSEGRDDKGRTIEARRQLAGRDGPEIFKPRYAWGNLHSAEAVTEGRGLDYRLDCSMEFPWRRLKYQDGAGQRFLTLRQRLGPGARIGRIELLGEFGDVELERRFYFDARGLALGALCLLGDGTPVLRTAYEYKGARAPGLWEERTEWETYAQGRKASRLLIKREYRQGGVRLDLDAKGLAVDRDGLDDSGGDEAKALEEFDGAKLSARGFIPLAEKMGRGKGIAAKILAEATLAATATPKPRGSCWDFVDSVYRACGLRPQDRQTAFLGAEGGPYARAAALRPGDWVYYRNLAAGGREHSAIFVQWIDFDEAYAVLIDYAGDNRVEAPRCRPGELWQVWRVMRAKD